MSNKKRIAWLVFLAFFAAGFGFVVGSDDAKATNIPHAAGQSSSTQN